MGFFLSRYICVWRGVLVARCVEVVPVVHVCCLSGTAVCSQGGGWVCGSRSVCGHVVALAWRMSAILLQF
jgi:hypothetical protein